MRTPRLCLASWRVFPWWLAHTRWAQLSSGHPGSKMLSRSEQKSSTGFNDARNALARGGTRYVLGSARGSPLQPREAAKERLAGQEVSQEPESFASGSLAQRRWLCLHWIYVGCFLLAALAQGQGWRGCWEQHCSPSTEGEELERPEKTSLCPAGGNTSFYSQARE